MQAVMESERRLGYVPRDVSDQKIGYDIESAIPNTGLLRFIEVKGRVRGAKTVTITKNEILTGLNKPDEFILAICLIDWRRMWKSDIAAQPFDREPRFQGDQRQLRPGRFVGPIPGAGMSKTPKKSSSGTVPATARRRADFDEVIRPDRRGPDPRRRRRQYGADRPVLVDRRVHQPQDCRRRLGQGNGCGARRPHPQTASERTGLFGQKSLANDAIFRDVSRPAKTRNTVARIVLEPQPGHHEPQQTR